MTQKNKYAKFPITNSVSSEYGLANIFLSQISFDENNGFSDVSMTQYSEKIFEVLDLDQKGLNGQVMSDKSQFSCDPSKDYDFNETSQDRQVFSLENLNAQQKKDPEIYSLSDKALPEEDIFTVPVGNYFKNGVLMCKWRPEIVLSKSFRTEVLSLAHEILYLAILMLPS